MATRTIHKGLFPDNGESCKSPGVNLNQSLGHIKKKRKKSNNKRQLNFSDLEIVLSTGAMAMFTHT